MFLARSSRPGNASMRQLQAAHLRQQAARLRAAAHRSDNLEGMAAADALERRADESGGPERTASPFPASPPASELPSRLGTQKHTGGRAGRPRSKFDR